MRRSSPRLAPLRGLPQLCVGGVLGAVGVGCSSAPPPPPDPLPVTARVEYREIPHAPWAASEHIPSEVGPAPSTMLVGLRVLRTGRLLDELGSGFEPLARSVLLITDPSGAEPLLPSLSLAALSFYARGELARTWLAARPDLQVVDQRTLQVDPEQITRLALEAHERQSVARGPRSAGRAPLSGLSMGLDLEPHVDGAHLTLWVERPESEDEERPREAAHLSLLLVPGGEPLLLLTRWDQFDGGGDNLVLELTPLAADAQADLRAPQPELQEERQAREALLLSIDRGQRRTALLEATRLGAEFTRDLLLQAEDEEFETFRRNLEHLPDRDTVTSSDLALTLALERTTLELLASRSQAGILTDWEQGLLLRHCGVAASYPDVLVGAALRAKNLPQLVRAFEQENLFALGSSDPAERLRGLRWLAARDLAPADYDPFAEAGARFEVLRAHDQARQEAFAAEQQAAASATEAATPAGAAASGAAPDTEVPAAQVPAVEAPAPEEPDAGTPDAVVPAAEEPAEEPAAEPSTDPDAPEGSR